MNLRHFTTSGRGWAYASTILGGAISIAANVAHSFIKPTNAPADWHPEPGAIFGAVAWPVVLFFAVETLARTPWPKKIGYHLLRWIGLPPVAFVAALVSYRHLSGLLAHYGEEHIVVVIGPIAIDGLMVMATGALIATAKRPIPTSVTHTEHHDQVVTATPAPTTTPTPTTAPAITAAPTVAPAAAPAVKKVAPAKKAAPRKRTPAKKATTPVSTTSTPTRPAVATPPVEQADPPAQRHPVPTAPDQAPAPSTHDTPVTAVEAAPPLKVPVPAALLTRARLIADAHHQATATPISKGTLAVQLRVNTDTAEQILAVLDLDANRPTTTTAANGAPVAVASR